jgi:hypothetical protein
MIWPAVVLTVALLVAAETLPRLIVPAGVAFGMIVIGRMVWWYTR